MPYTDPVSIYSITTTILLVTFIITNLAKNQPANAISGGSSWFCSSLCVIFIMTAIYSTMQVGVSTPQNVLMMYLLCIITLCSSLSMVIASFYN